MRKYSINDNNMLCINDEEFGKFSNNKYNDTIQILMNYIWLKDHNDSFYDHATDVYENFKLSDMLYNKYHNDYENALKAELAKLEDAVTVYTITKKNKTNVMNIFYNCLALKYVYNREYAAYIENNEIKYSEIYKG